MNWPYVAETLAVESGYLMVDPLKGLPAPSLTSQAQTTSRVEPNNLPHFKEFALTNI